MQPWKPTATSARRASTEVIAAPSTPSPKPKISSGSHAAVSSPPESVTYMARLASPAARRTPEHAMPRPISGVVGITMSRKRHAISCVRPVAPNSVRIGREQRQRGEGEHERDRRHEHERGGREPPRFLAPPRAERARDQRGARDGDADPERHREEQHRAGIADRGRKLLLAEQRDVEQVEEIDDEDRHQADRAGRGHHHDMAHGRAVGEFRRGGGEAAVVMAATFQVWKSKSTGEVRRTRPVCSIGRF